MNTTDTVEKKRRIRRIVSARAKAQAILSVWSGRRSASQVCRELAVTWGSVKGWEKTGIVGILKALGGEPPQLSGRGELGRRLEGLLAEVGAAETASPAPSLVASGAGENRE